MCNMIFLLRLTTTSNSSSTLKPFDFFLQTEAPLSVNISAMVLMIFLQWWWWWWWWGWWQWLQCLAAGAGLQAKLPHHQDCQQVILRESWLHPERRWWWWWYLWCLISFLNDWQMTKQTIVKQFNYWSVTNEKARTECCCLCIQNDTAVTLGTFPHAHSQWISWL